LSYRAHQFTQRSSEKRTEEIVERPKKKLWKKQSAGQVDALLDLMVDKSTEGGPDGHNREK